MAYNEENIKNVVKEGLQQISREVAEAFAQEPSVHIAQKAVNEKIAAIVAAAFEQFSKDADVVIPMQQVVPTLTAGPVPVTGTVTVPAHKGKIT